MKPDVRARYLDVRPVPGGVRGTEYSKLSVTVRDDPTAEGNPAPTSLGVSRITIADCDIDGSAIRMHRCERVSATMRSHEECLGKRRAICRDDPRLESSALRRSQHADDVIANRGVQVVERRTRVARRLGKGAKRHRGDSPLELLPRLAAPANRRESD